MTDKMNAVLKTLLDAAMELEGALDTPAANDMVYAWNNGLGVKLVDQNQASVVGVLHASKLPSGMVFLNGASEKAIHMLRSRALRIGITKINESLAILKEAV